MFSTGATTSDVASWVEKSLKNENLTDFDVILSVNTAKGEGYFSEIVFARVRGTTEYNKRKVLNLAIKHGKNDCILRKVTKIKGAFEREIYFYDKIVPALKMFQSAKNISFGFECTPKCYLTLVLQQSEVLVFENLKQQGYTLCDKRHSLDINHLKLILNEYSKLHALSFALRDQKREEFNSIANYGLPFEEFFMTRNKADAFDKNNGEVLNLLRHRVEKKLHKKLETLLMRDSNNLILELEPEKESQSAILHGDSWINNFMFIYKDYEKTSPCDLKILDWQLSTLRSPVFDLSYLIYGCSSKENLDRLEELLETYYASFSDFLRKLGSNPETLFTYIDLKRHWKKYSVFAVLIVATLFRFVYSESESASEGLDNLREGQDLSEFLSPKVDDTDTYCERLKAVYTHYFEYNMK